MFPVLMQCTTLDDYDNQQVQEALSDSALSITESWDVSLSFLEYGKRKLILTGSYARSEKSTQRVATDIAGPIDITIFDDSARVSTHVWADSAVYLSKIATFRLYGNVRVHTVDGKRLRSDYLQWERNEDKISTPEFVIFISPPDSIAANGFFGNTDLTNYTLNEGGGTVIIN